MRQPRAYARSRLTLAAFFVVAGTLHLAAPRIYRGIVPPYLPYPVLLIHLSGACEILGGIGLLWAPARAAAGAGLVALLLLLLPANVQMLAAWRAKEGAGWIEMLLWLRLPLQFILMGWIWRVSRSSPETA
ncbi:MAG: hypothetical protein H0V09_02005 [Gemmatimonadetes bacterium]|nr:hypothetical protein [Gemmatimonadota bacterium]